MPAVPRQPPKIWDDVKPLILEYFITQDKTLKETMHLIKTQRGFIATIKEYRHRLGKWGIRKNLPHNAWKDIDEQIVDGTQIIKGIPVSSKRLKRSVSRYAVQNGSKRQLVNFPRDIPWFYFQDRNLPCLRSQIESLIPQLCWINPPGIPTHAFSPAEFSMASARALIQSFFHFENTQQAHDVSSQVIINLRKYMPRRSGTNNELISTEPFFLLVWSCIYLSSNQLLTDAMMSGFLLWVNEIGAAPCMDNFINNLVNNLQKNTNASTEVFLYHLLRHASNLEMEGLVLILLKKGVRPNQRLSQSPDLDWYLDRDCNWYTPLQIATYRGNLPICKLLLKHEANADAESLEWMMSPLFIAVSVGNLEIINELIESGADVDCYSDEKVVYRGPRGEPISVSAPRRSVLMEAVELQQLQITKSLLESGADAHDLSFVLGSPLQIAIRKGDVQMTELLLQNGACLDQVAATEAFIVEEVSDHLAVHGHLFTDPDFPETIPGKYVYALKVQALLMPLQIAAFQDDTEMVKFLLSIGVQPQHQRLDGGRVWNQILQLPFVIADPELERKLVKKGMNYSVLWLQASQSALHLAAKNGNVEIITCLLEAHAIVDDIDDSETTALQVSCGLRQEIHKEDDHATGYRTAEVWDAGLSDSNFNFNLVGLLLDWKANVNFPAGRPRGRTALQAAVESRNVDLVTFLLSCGADVNSPASQIGGLTAIEAAAWTGKFTLRKILLQSGATSDATIDNIALHMAARNGYDSDFIALLATVVDIHTILKSPPISGLKGSLLQAAIRGGHPAIIETLLGHPFDLNAVFDEETALCTAVQAEFPDMLEILLLKGADPNTRGVRETPLAMAAALKSRQMVETLLNAGASVDQLSQHPKLGYAETLGWTLQRWEERGAKDRFERYATRELSPDSLAIVSLLLQYGADPNKMAFGLWYPIELVAKLKNGALLAMLLDNNANVDAPCSRPKLKWAFAFWNSDLWEGMTLESEQITRRIINSSKTLTDRGALLSLAVEHEYFSWAEQLLEEEASMNSTLTSGSALAWACRHGQIDLVKKLLDGNIGLGEPIQTDGFICSKEASDCCASYLQIATRSGHFNIVRLILDRGARDSACYACGKTALKVAASRGYLDIAFLLLQHQSESRGMKSRCLDAAETAADSGYQMLAQKLMQY
ncbi:hypothetical protein ACHAPU_006378 [Fusarium lateritium]